MGSGKGAAGSVLAGWAAAALAVAVLSGPDPASAGPASNPATVAASVAPDNGRTCTTSRLPVELTPGLLIAPGSSLGIALGKSLGQQYVVVKLCLPNGRPVPQTVQVLVHGITYDHRYWNIADPADPRGNRYSWEYAAAQAGYATAAIDQLGNGDSSHPLSAFVDIDSNATAVHDVVQALRAGKLTAAGQARPSFANVVLVGHSYGSMTSFIEASRFHDVDALLLEGVSHNVREVAAPVNIEGNMYPAVLDPQFAGTLLDPGYITPLPGSQRSLFYAPGTDVDPRIIQRDAATKGTVSQFELLNYPIIFRTKLDVRAPVFIINGSKDGIFCHQTLLDLGAPCLSAASLVANERPWFGPRVPSLDAYIVNGAGHDLNAFRSSQQTFAASMSWLLNKVPA
jgi:pimeloyl-ACP methyl ester carboxylesterase